MLGPGLVAVLSGGVNIDLLQPLGGLNDRTQVHVRVSVLSGPDHALRAAGAGEPDVGPGFLHGHHPRVDHAVLIMLSLVPEWSRLGPAFYDQVMGLFEPLPVLGRVDARLESLHSPAPDETGYDPTAGVAIEHGHFFGHPDGVIHGDHVAEDRDLDLLGDFCQHGGV